MEIWDGYLADGALAGIDLVRGEPIPEGIYFMTVEILVRHTDGDYLLMMRDPTKPAFPGYLEATAGGAAQKGEDPLTAAIRELREETGICKSETDFEYLTTTYDTHLFFDHYCVKAKVPLEQIVLQPGETDDAKWVTFDEVHRIIARKEMCSIIANEYLSLEAQLRMRQNA